MKGRSTATVICLDAMNIAKMRFEVILPGESLDTSTATFATKVGGGLIVNGRFVAVGVILGLETHRALVTDKRICATSVTVQAMLIA